jgi:hypothetical protein
VRLTQKSFDLVNEPEAKTRWQRAKPPGVVVGLPGYLVAGEWVGVSRVYMSCARMDGSDCSSTTPLCIRVHSIADQSIDDGGL